MVAGGMTDALCFDLFGTLCDTTTDRETFTATLRDETTFGDDDIRAVYRTWRDRHRQYARLTTAMGASPPYREVMVRALAYALERHDTDLTRAARRRILDARETIPAYPGAAPALEALADAGFTVTVLSNGDPDVLREITTNTGLHEHLARVISAGDAGVFKPAPAAYAHAATILDRPIGTCWLVSAHSWDARGAANAGMLGAWINRDDHPHDHVGRRPAIVAESLEDFVQRFTDHQ